MKHFRHILFGEMTRLKYITSEILYTIFIILVTTSIVYLMLLPKIKQNLSTTALLQQETSQEIATQSADISNADSYIEQGSPYDKRTIGTDSANVIFHGDRSKKQIAITFDAEMTDGMKAAYNSGRVKSLYEKRIIDILNDTHTKATLFLTGMWIELYPVITKELSQNSLFELGSHSYTDSSYHGFCYGLSELPNTLKIEDGWQRVRVTLAAPNSACFWIAPIETVSESEEGFERVYQGSQIMPIWRIDLGNEKTWTARLVWRI